MVKKMTKVQNVLQNWLPKNCQIYPQNRPKLPKMFNIFFLIDPNYQIFKQTGQKLTTQIIQLLNKMVKNEPKL